VEARLEELKAETAEFEQKLNRLAEQEEEALANLNAADLKLRAAENKCSAQVDNEKTTSAAAKAAEAKTVIATGKLNGINAKIGSIITKVKDQIDKVGEANKDLEKETGAFSESLIQLMALVQKDATIKHEKLSLSHSTAAEKLAKVEAAIKEHDNEECDDVRAQVIIAKGELATTGVALKTCLQTKKVISTKIAAIQKAREVAQKKLDDCLSTKAKLKAGLDECHTRRDAAREKLEECLDRKKELNKKIAACHAKRDEARKKLAQCLASKKSLAAKIAAAKAKLGSLSAASFMEILNKHVQDEGEEDMEILLDELETSNDEFDEALAESKSNGEDENAAIAESQAVSEKEDEIVEEISKAEGDASAETDGEDAAMQGGMMDALSALKTMDADSDAATAACQAAEAAVAQGEQSLLAFQARISKQ